jgi:hypothetical protein
MNVITITTAKIIALFSILLSLYQIFFWLELQQVHIITEIVFFQLFETQIFWALFLAIILYYFGTKIEFYRGEKSYLVFFIVILSILVWGAYYTEIIIRNSSFLELSLLWAFMYLLKKENDPQYKWGFTAGIIIGWLWFVQWESFLINMVWMLIGFMYFFLYDTIYKKYQ